MKTRTDSISQLQELEKKIIKTSAQHSLISIEAVLRPTDKNVNMFLKMDKRLKSMIADFQLLKEVAVASVLKMNHCRKNLMNKDLILN